MQSCEKYKFGFFEKRSFSLTVLVLLQLVTFIVIHDGANELAKQFWTPSKAGIGWGLLVHFSVYAFAVLSIIAAVLIFTVFSKQISIVLFINLLIFSTVFLSHVGDRPYRTLLLIFSASSGFFFPTMLMRNQIKEI